MRLSPKTIRLFVLGAALAAVLGLPRLASQPTQDRAVDGPLVASPTILLADGQETNPPPKKG